MPVSCFRQRRQGTSVDGWINLCAREEASFVASGDEDDRVLGAFSRIKIRVAVEKTGRPPAPP